MPLLAGQYDAAKRALPEGIDGTARIEAFSDGVIAIIVTLLIFEIRVPVLAEISNSAVINALMGMGPKFASFAVSFFTVAIFWVNHHHFFCQIHRSNWKLLWFNNLLLFWLAIVPFTTAFVGDHPTQPLVVCLYALTLCLAALSFSLMGYYVFLKSDLMPDSVSAAERRSRVEVGDRGHLRSTVPLPRYRLFMFLPHSRL